MELVDRHVADLLLAKVSGPGVGVAGHAVLGAGRLAAAAALLAVL